MLPLFVFRILVRRAGLRFAWKWRAETIEGWLRIGRSIAAPVGKLTMLPRSIRPGEVNLHLCDVDAASESDEAACDEIREDGDAPTIYKPSQFVWG